MNKKKCQEKRSQLQSFNTIKTFTLAHRDSDAELSDTPGFKGGRGAAVKELTLQRGLFISMNQCPPPSQRPTESNSFCSSLWTGGNWRAHGRAAVPVQRFDFLEWQLDELRHEELALWRSNSAAGQEKSSSGLCSACLRNAKELSRRSLRRVPQQGRHISKSYLFTGDPERMFVGSCRRVEAPEIQDAVTSSRSRQQKIYLSRLLGACHCFKCYNYHLVSSCRDSPVAVSFATTLMVVIYVI